MTLPDPDPIQVWTNARQLIGPKTGTEVYMELLLAALSRTGRVLVNAVSSEPLNLALPRVREVILGRRPSYKAGSPAATLWKLWFDQWRCLSTAPRGGILFHGMVGFLPYSLRRRDRAVITVHDLGWRAHPELYSRRLRTMYGALFPWAARRADRFIAVSRYTADDLVRRMGVSASKVDVVYHGLDPTFVAPENRGWGGTGDRPYVLAVGGVSPRKNTRRLITAFSRWRARGGHRSAYRLLITGTSLDREFAQNGSPLPEGVSLLGYVEKAELPGLYANAATFLYPGIYEGFGLPIIEAMAAGTPVVTSETGAAPEIAAGAAILVDPFRVESIEAGLEQATLPAEAQRLRELGRQRAKYFEWNRAAEATIDTYRKLMN